MDAKESGIGDPSREPQPLDLESRLREIPDAARVRGVFFRILQDDLARRGLKDRASWNWEAVLGEQPRSYRLYPVRHLLEAYAVAAPLVAADPHQGIREIFQSACVAYSESWFGQSLKRFLEPDPLRALLWIERSRDHVCDYGLWRVQVHGPTRVTVHMFDEYLWIESAHRGGCEGLLRACGVEGEVTAEVDGPFQGRLQVSWERV